MFGTQKKKGKERKRKREKGKNVLGMKWKRIMKSKIYLG